MSESVAPATLKEQRFVDPPLNLDLFAKEGLFVAQDLLRDGAVWVREGER